MAAWRIHRALLDHTNLRRSFSDDDTCRALFLTIKDEISQAQVFPFFQNQVELKNCFELEIRELPLNEFLAGSHHYRHHVDVVFLQTWFETPIKRIVDAIKSRWPTTKLVYLDWFAPTDLRFADALAGEVAAYVKKQVLADFSEYGRATWGHTNLSDYYSKRFGLDIPEVTFPVPARFRDSLVLGHGFERSPRIVRQIPSDLSFADRNIDLHARIAATGTPWYSAMRNEANRAVSELPSSLKIASTGYVKAGKFMDELRRSKLCFSPFGYGEICWRDFEAMAAGAMLLKPDVSHLLMEGNYFEPYETYVPVSWDLSDLQDKVDYYLSRPSERARIAQNALRRLKQEKPFIQQLAPLWRQLGLASGTWFAGSNHVNVSNSKPLRWGCNTQ